VPLQEAGKITFLHGESTVVPGVEVIPMPGHNADMQAVKLTGGGKTAFLFADLIPTTAHLPLPWIMGYDLYPMKTLENKKKWVPKVIEEEWLALFVHDAQTPAAYVREKDGKVETEPVEVG
jgi:glyoxylase-like metal-dependent hydrolase (beta-lactamase superfamily II)